MATIEGYKAAWEAAKAAGDTAGMNAAHQGAEAIRAQQGYSGGADGSQYIPLSGNTGGGNTGGGGYTPTGTYNDQGLSSQDMAKINALKSQYDAAKARGDTAGMEAAHSTAEALRLQYGYSGGKDGSEYNPFDDPNKYNKQPIAGPTSQSRYVDSLYAAQREAALAALKAAYDQNVIDLDAQAAKIPQTYQAARNQTAAAAQQGQAAFDERAAAMGLSSGAGGQAALSMANASTANQNTINTQEANAVTDLDTMRLKVSTAYQNDIAQAIAQGDIARAQALYQEAVRVDNGMVQQSMTQADENYRYWSTNQSQQLQMAETLAKFGDFSGFLAMGYTPQQIENMKRTWDIMNPQVSGYGAYGGYSGGSSRVGASTTTTATPDVAFGVSVPEGLEREVGMSRTKQGQSATIERLFNSGRITEAQAKELYKRMGI